MDSPAGQILQILPTRTGGAAENMALDFLLLTRCPGPPAPRFRHYGWRAPAFTFGYSQKISWVRENLPAGGHFDLCRRPTGGGLVDHRDDWTYALVVPRSHGWYDARATQSYRIVHECLAAALVALGQPAQVKEQCDPDAGEGIEAGGEASPQASASCGMPGICFRKAERYDVVNARTAAKIAGAAQKRSKHGLLFQGSIEKNAVGAIDWDAFQDGFVAELAQAMGLAAANAPWPELAEHEVEGLIEQYSSPEWVEHR